MKTDHAKTDHKTDHKTEYTKTAMTISCTITILTWLAAIASWFLKGEMPLELLKYTSILYCVFFACYCCKTGYETYCKYRYEQDNTIQDIKRGAERGIKRGAERGGD